MKIDEIIANITVNDDLSIEQKINIVGQVVFTLDEQVTRLEADVKKLRADVTRLEQLAGYGKDASM